MPSSMSVCRRMVRPAPLASAVWRSLADERPVGGHAAVVEDRLAHEVHVDAALDALDRAHEQVVGVVVERRPRVRRDGVLGAARTERERVADDEPARSATCQVVTSAFVPGSYARADGTLVPNGPSRK